MVNYTFCHCGRIENSARCLTEKHKEKGRKTAERKPKFSGKSEYVKENGQFSGTRGR